MSSDSVSASTHNTRGAAKTPRDGPSVTIFENFSPQISNEPHVANLMALAQNISLTDAFRNPASTGGARSEAIATITQKLFTAIAMAGPQWRALMKNMEDGSAIPAIPKAPILTPEDKADSAILRLIIDNYKIEHANATNIIAVNNAFVIALHEFAGDNFDHVLTKPPPLGTPNVAGFPPPKTLHGHTIHSILHILRTDCNIVASSFTKNALWEQFTTAFPPGLTMAYLISLHAKIGSVLTREGRGVVAAEFSEQFLRNLKPNYPHFHDMVHDFNRTRSQDHERTWSLMIQYFLTRADEVEAALPADKRPTDPTSRAAHAANVIDDDHDDLGHAHAAKAGKPRGRQGTPPNLGKPKVSVEISNLDINAIAPMLRHHGLMLVPSPAANRSNNRDNARSGVNQQPPAGPNGPKWNRTPGLNTNRNTYAGKNNGGYNRGGGRGNPNQRRANATSDAQDATDEANNLTDADIAADDAAYYTALPELYPDSDYDDYDT
jgi:hypothetical protein